MSAGELRSSVKAELLGNRIWKYRREKRRPGERFRVFAVTKLRDIWNRAHLLGNGRVWDTNLGFIITISLWYVLRDLGEYF